MFPLMGAIVCMQSLAIRHVFDEMNCEKNLCENIMKTIWGLKDNLKVRMDLAEANIRPELHAISSSVEGTLLIQELRIFCLEMKRLCLQISSMD